eukprot:3929660-Prymnesium_polylepis.1
MCFARAALARIHPSKLREKPFTHARASSDYVRVCVCAQVSAVGRRTVLRRRRPVQDRSFCMCFARAARARVHPSKLREKPFTHARASSDDVRVCLCTGERRRSSNRSQPPPARSGPLLLHVLRARGACARPPVQPA